MKYDGDWCICECMQPCLKLLWYVFSAMVVCAASSPRQITYDLFNAWQPHFSLALEPHHSNVDPWLSTMSAGSTNSF